MTVRQLSPEQKKKLISIICDSYHVDVSVLEKYYFYQTLKDRVYISEINLIDTLKSFSLRAENVMNLGVYLGRIHFKNLFRLSHKGLQLLKPQGIAIDEPLVSSFLFGENLLLDELDSKDFSGFIPLLSNGVYLGCVHKTQKEYMNYLPKSKRIKHGRLF